jgi:hypothetical protein
MDEEMLGYVRVPFAVTVASLVGTVAISLRDRSVVQRLLTAIALPCASIAVVLWFVAFTGVWVNYWPYVLTPPAAIAALAQLAVWAKHSSR